MKEATIATTSGSEIEVNKYVGPVSILMRFLTSKDVAFSSYFDGKFEDKFNVTTSKETLLNNHSLQTNKGKVFDQLPLEHIFGFCKTIKKVTRKLGFQITLETNELQDIVYSTSPPPTIIIVLFDKLHLFEPNFIPSSGTQAYFNESMKDIFSLLFDSWKTDRKVVRNSEHQFESISCKS